MAEDVNSVNTDVLKGIKGAQDSGLTVNDFNNFVPSDLSPEQKQLYLQQQKINQNPATGPLNYSDYYPGVNNQILQGYSSGSETGSQPIYAPGLSLVPIAMMDAKDAALQHAALSKMKEIDDFKNKYKAPTTKHSSVQKELDKTYFNGLQQWVNNAKQKYGQNWAPALENDVNFQRWNKSAQTAAQQEDYIVNKFADVQHQINSGKFVSTPELTKAMADFHAGLNGLGESPFNPEGHKLNEYYSRLNAEHDFANVANEYITHAVKQKLASAGIDESNPDYLRMYKSTTEQFTPETLKGIAESMHGTHFPNMSVEDINKRLTPMFGSARKESEVSVHNTKEGGENDHYGNNDFSDEPTNINANVSQTGGGSRVGNIEGNDGLTFKKPINAQVPVGQRVYINDKTHGLVKSNVTGNMDAKLGKMVVVPVLSLPGNANDGTPLTQDQIEKIKSGKWTDAKGNKVNVGPQNIKYESMVTGHYGDEKHQTSFMVPTKDVENALVKRWSKDGKTVEQGIPVDISYQKAQQRTAAHVDKNVFPDQIEIKGKKWPKAKVEDAAKKSGMTVEEYLSELNKQ